MAEPPAEPQSLVGAEDFSSAQPPPEEEKSSDEHAGFTHKTEEKTSAQGKRKKRYDGSGRRNTDDEIDEILDAYILWNKLPQDVSERQRRDYRKHPRLELRRMYLEQAGFVKRPRASKSATAKNAGNVHSFTERKAKRARDAS